MDERSVRLREIFEPEAVGRLRRVHSDGLRFVYYTTADVAVQILRTRRMWMRSTQTMNDFSEVEHGLQCVLNAYRGEQGRRLKAAVEAAVPGVMDRVEGTFNAWVPAFTRDTYIACVSEHPAIEDGIGRLSMWRAYGGRTGVGIVFNTHALELDTDAFGAYSHPVAYWRDDEVAAEFERVARNVAANVEFLRTWDPKVVQSTIFSALRFTAVCTKHPGFAEEREWRIVAAPAMHEGPMRELAVEVVRGVPQKVLKLILEDRPEHGVAGLDVSRLLHQIIVGPCETPTVIWQALVSELAAAGVVDAVERVRISDIPLRHPTA